MSRLRLALCQMNATVGDLSGNAERILEGIEAAPQAGAQVVLFPELALTGYPPEDLLLREHFLEDTGAKLHELASAAEGIVAIVGFPERGSGSVYNSAAVLAGGAVHAIYRKVHLPNYGVFDEQRYFKAGEPGGTVIELECWTVGVSSSEAQSCRRAITVGVTVCEDLWVAGAPATSEATPARALIVNISASPYHAGKGLERERLFAQRARETAPMSLSARWSAARTSSSSTANRSCSNQDGETIARARSSRRICSCATSMSPQGPCRATTRQRKPPHLRPSTQLSSPPSTDPIAP